MREEPEAAALKREHLVYLEALAAAAALCPALLLLGLAVALFLGVVGAVAALAKILRMF